MQELVGEGVLVFMTLHGYTRVGVALGAILTTKTGSFFSTGEDSFTFVFFTGLDLEFKASFC